MNSGPVTLSGRWAVIRIETGSSEPIIVPRELGARFSWTPAGRQRVLGPSGDWENRYFGPSLDASDGASSYGCSYDRDGDKLALSSCTATLDVRANPSDLEQRVGAAFEEAFSNTTMTVTSTSEGVLAVTLGHVVFTLTKAD